MISRSVGFRAALLLRLTRYVGTVLAGFVLFAVVYALARNAPPEVIFFG